MLDMALRLSPGTVIGLVAFFICGLALDTYSPLRGQLITSVLSWVLLGMLFWSGSTLRRQMMLWCLVYATLGELFFSLFWGLYQYRLDNIPPFVPPGHVLLFLLGVNLAPYLPSLFRWLVPIISAPIFIYGFYQGFDQFDLILFAFFLACLASRGDTQLYVTMFLLALGLELYGTALQAWTWKPIIPYWGLTATNPPYASGTLYCLLDFLILMSIPAIQKQNREHLAD